MRYIYPLLGFIVLCSCGAPLQIVRVEPSADVSVDRYFYGNPILRTERSGIVVETNFYDASPDYLVFDVQVINNGNDDVLFDPVASSLSTELGEQRGAVDPEFQLFSLDWETIKRRKANRTMAWVSAGVLVASTAYALAEGARSEDIVNTTLTTSDLVAQIGLSAVDAMTFTILTGNNGPDEGLAPEAPDPSNRFFWLDHSFRLTTIRPGERATGKLVFERLDQASQLTLSIPVGDETYIFPFDQRTFRPGRDRVDTDVR